MGVDNLVGSCDAKPFDGRRDVVTTHQKAQVQKLCRVLEGHQQKGGYGRTTFGFAAWVIDFFPCQCVVSYRPELKAGNTNGS